MLIDSHIHLNSEKYLESYQEKSILDVIPILIKNADEVGVRKFITVATGIEEFETLTKISDQFDNVYHTLGIYPKYNQGVKLNDLEVTIENFINPKTVAIGECGFNQPLQENDRNLKSQRSLFEMQINLAIRKKLPIVIHNRNSDQETIEVLNTYKSSGLTGVIHCFVSDYHFAKQAMDLGFYLSFNGIITYKSGESIYETIQKMPLDRILIETDAPYLSPEGFRKITNEPKYLPIILNKISEIRNISKEELEEQIYSNTYRLFDKIKK